jgi:hypothetical protein
MYFFLREGGSVSKYLLIEFSFYIYGPKLEEVRYLKRSNG